ncbi:MAG: phosphoribosylanthranilate isomerase [Cyanobacteriota bacterium]
MESATTTGTSRAGRTRLKICGLRDPRQASAIAAMGVDAIGVVAVPSSPRFLAVDDRLPLFAAAREAHESLLGVVVTADPEDRELPTLLAGHGHQVVQLHGGESVERCRDLRSKLGPEMRIWKALRVRRKADLESARAYADVVDALLLDAWVPDQLGGTGRAIPLDWLEGFRPSLPWWLAGGLTPQSVAPAIQACHPNGVDVSSGVEDRPGWKNLERVRELVEQLTTMG